MSRIGKQPIEVPESVEVKMDGKHLTVKGPKGQLERTIVDGITLKFENGIITVSKEKNLKTLNGLFGLTRALVANMVEGVVNGFTKTLEINGVGYRAQKQGKKLVLSLGYSHPVEMEEPEGITVDVNGNKLLVQGIDKEKVGQFAAEIREKRLPEVYRGKGIKYDYEVIKRKEGKAGKSA